ncbi:hypothetical protein KIL84_002758 [Mauremys mutica]|uniref:Steroidogenic acute regulatory protein, mitochondrial n=1 Tax=Mauremys mutica TaxID=74926 RepID=A0A9D3WUX0_9SAUR|nr:hypothetical protein KIL84_002758 [Mauremys mutica]
MNKHFALAPVVAGEKHGSEVNSSWFSNTELSYVNQGEATLRGALGILQQQDGWQTETYQGKGELVLSTVLPRLGKVFRMETVLDVPVDQLYYELFENLEQMPEWNPTLSRVKILQRIGKDTLLTHEIAAQHPGNLIGQRDFVSVRHCWKKETTVYLVGTATHSEFMPMQKGQVSTCLRQVSILVSDTRGRLSRIHPFRMLGTSYKGLDFLSSQVKTRSGLSPSHEA